MILMKGRLLTDCQDYEAGVRYPYGFSAPGRDIKYQDDSDQWHGTCVTSKAIGLSNGVYKYPERGIMLKSSPSVFETLWAFSKARDITKNPGMASVVVFTGATPDTDESLTLWIRVKEIIKEIFEAGSIVVVTAGNYAEAPGRSNVDTIPASWASSEFPLIVVGAVDNLGNRASFSQTGSNLVTMHAPGVGVSCPHSEQHEFSGTSFAAPMVSLSLTTIIEKY